MLLTGRIVLHVHDERANPLPYRVLPDRQRLPSLTGVSADSGSAFSWDGQQYHFNWQTPSTGAGYYYRIGVRLDDGQTYSVNIGLR